MPLLGAFSLQAGVFAVKCAEGKDVTHELAAALAGAKDGGELFLPRGRYFIKGVLALQDVKNFTLRGEEGTVIVTSFSPTGYLNSCNAAMKIRRVENLLVEKIAFACDNPTGSAGRIAGLDPQNGTFDVEIDEGFPVDGTECVASLDLCNGAGMPLRRLSLTGRLDQKRDEKGKVHLNVQGVPYEKVSSRTLRFKAPGGKKYDFGQVRFGDRVAIRHSLWGGGLLTFTDAEDVALKDVTVERCMAMAVVIEARCRNFAFERFRIAPGKGSNAIFSSNADGIHALGLGGKLVLKDCFFEGLGDDALNVHSRAGIVKEVGRSGLQAKCISKSYDGAELALGEKWARKGDVLDVYDPRNFLRKGKLRLESYSKGECVFAPGGVEPEAGDVVANSAFAPSVEISGCTCRVMRARGFLLQTGNVEVRNCVFSDIALQALLFAPDVERWYEMSPSENVIVNACRFERCAAVDASGSLAAIDFRTSHGGRNRVCPPGVHSGIAIVGNDFSGCEGTAVAIASASGVELKDNRFSRCPVFSCDPEKPHDSRAVRLVQCQLKEQK